jgi:hypothetical protein
MAKIVRVNTGGSNSYAGDSAAYKIVVDSGGKIVFNTGNQLGDVVITGSLTVLGTTTSLETTNTQISDNIIVLNKGEDGAGVTLGASGLEIDRGSVAAARWVYEDSGDLEAVPNVWRAKYATTEAFIPIATNYIWTDEGNLTLIGQGTGVITVTGTTDYESQVTSDDVIPNKKYVDDYVAYYVATHPPDEIIDADTRVTVSDFATSGSPSQVEFVVNNIVKGTIDANGFVSGTVRLEGNTISEDTSDTLHIDAYLALDNRVTTPSTPSTNVKLYSTATPGNGGTGVYFVNTEGTNDELISKTKALLFALIL